ncbi:hypothetical protein IJ556_00645 [bacterium]|nr:hypothetical protein [bacterium]
MEDYSKDFTQTAGALESLRQTVESLDHDITVELASKDKLKEAVSHLKQELRDKAARIDSIIETLNGALK